MGREYVTTTLPRTILRVSPELKADVLAVVPKGTSLEIVSETKDVCQVAVRLEDRGEVLGYVEKSKIGMSSPDDTEQQEVLAVCACGENQWIPVECFAGTHYALRIPIGLFTSIRVRARVCRNCGRMEQYVDKSDLPSLEE